MDINNVNNNFTNGVSEHQNEKLLINCFQKASSLCQCYSDLPIYKFKENQTICTKNKSDI